MKNLILLAICILFASCTLGPMKNHYFDEQGNLIRTEEGGWISLGMLETAEGYNTLYVNKGVGLDSSIPIPFAQGMAEWKLSLGYLNNQRLFIDENSVLILDVGIGVLKEGTDITDTLLHGKEAVKGYKDFLETNKEEAVVE
jgi:hypothetical protein